MGLKKKTTARNTKAAMPKYVHWTLLKSLGSVWLKNTRDARRGVMTEPTAWKDWLSSRRNSERRGGPQVAMNGLARADKPDPTMKRLPQTPPKLR